MELPKIRFSPAVAGYLAVGIATVGLLWWLKNHLGESVLEGISKTSAMVDEAATNYGQISSQQELGAYQKYVSARSAYAKSIGWNFVKQGYDIPDWPSYYFWLYGAGPEGYTYGSSAYPKDEQGFAFLNALSSVF